MNVREHRTQVQAVSRKTKAVSRSLSLREHEVSAQAVTNKGGLQAAREQEGAGREQESIRDRQRSGVAGWSGMMQVAGREQRGGVQAVIRKMLIRSRGGRAGSDQEDAGREQRWVCRQ